MGFFCFSTFWVPQTFEKKNFCQTPKNTLGFSQTQDLLLAQDFEAFTRLPLDILVNEQMTFQNMTSALKAAFQPFHDTLKVAFQAFHDHFWHSNSDIRNVQI